MAVETILLNRCCDCLEESICDCFAVVQPKKCKIILPGGFYSAPFPGQCENCGVVDESELILTATSNQCQWIKGAACPDDGIDNECDDPYRALFLLSAQVDLQPQYADAETCAVQADVTISWIPWNTSTLQYNCGSAYGVTRYRWRDDDIHPLAATGQHTYSLPFDSYSNLFGSAPCNKSITGDLILTI